MKVRYKTPRGITSRRFDETVNAFARAFDEASDDIIIEMTPQ